jgi:cytoskeletal protein RodZ
MAGEGKRLREERERRGFTYEDLEDQTKIRKVYLQALENEAHWELPGDAYIRAFLRSYSRALELDPDEIVGLYLAKVKTDELRVPNIQFKKTSILSVPLVISICVIIGFLGFLGYKMFFSMGGNGTEIVYGEPQNLPRDDEYSQSASTNTPPLTVNIVFEERCWLIVNADGVKELEGLIEAGENRTITAQENIEFVAVGYPAGIRVNFNGKNLDRFGSSLTPIYNYVLKLDSQ